MEELLKTIDFDMDTSDLDCLSDDLLDEDDLLNIDDLLTNSEYEDLEEDDNQELEDIEFDIDSFFVSEKRDEKEFKKLNRILNRLTYSKDTSLNSISINNLVLFNSFTINSSSTTNNSTNRSQFNKEIDSSCDTNSSSDEESNSQIDNSEITSSQFNDDNKIQFSINYYLNDKKTDKRSKKYNNKKLNRSFDKKFDKIEKSNTIKRKLSSSSKGTSLLAKPKSLQKLKNDLTELNQQTDYDSFINYFYQEHNYCIFN